MGRTLIFFGAPGSGKGTLASRVNSHFKTVSVSSGDLLRRHVYQETPIGKHIKSILASGGFVNDSLVQELIHSELKSLRGKNILLDGFPRTVTQAKWLSGILDDHSRDTDAVVNLKVPESVILKRIEDRWIHSPSGRTYNMSFNPPQRAGFDDVTGEPLSKRPDDNVETLKVRLQKFKETTAPILDYYHDRGALKSFTGETSDELFPQIHSSLKDIFDKPKVTMNKI